MSDQKLAFQSYDYQGRVSRCSVFPEVFVHAALFVALLTWFSAVLLPVTERTKDCRNEQSTGYL